MRIHVTSTNSGLKSAYTHISQLYRVSGYNYGSASYNYIVVHPRQYVLYSQNLMKYLSFLCTCILQNKIKHIDVFSFQQVFMHESQVNRNFTGVKMFNRSLCLPRVWIKWIYLWPNSHKIIRVMSFWRDSILGVCTLCLSAIKLSVSSQAAGMFPNDRSRNISIHCRLKRSVVQP